MKHYNFTLRSTIIVMIFIALLFAVMTGVNYFFTSEILSEKALMDTKNDIRLLSIQVDDVLKKVESAVVSVKTHYLHDNISTRDLKKHLRTITEDNNLIISAHGIYFSPSTGFNSEKYAVITYPVANTPASQMEVSENYIDEIVKSGLNETALFWSEPFLHPATNELSLACVSPSNFILPDSMLTRGFLVATISLKWIDKFISQDNMFNSASILVLSNDAKPIASSGQHYNYKDDIFTIAKATQNAEIVDLGSKMKSGKSGFLEIKNFGLKGPSFVSFQPLARNGWSVAAGIVKSELFSGLYFTSVLLIITAIFVLILVFWLHLIIARNVIVPLRAITTSIKKISSDKVGVVLPKIIKPLILAELTDAISMMQIDFQHYVNSMGKKAKEPENFTGNALSNNQINKIRLSLLRHDFESFTANRNFEMAAMFRITGGGYGNFYDYFMINNHTLCFCIGDVKGKGLPALLFISGIINLFRTGNYLNESLGRVVTGINHELFQQNTDGLTASFFAGMFNLENSELIFCNANHPFPYLIKGGDLFEAHGTHGNALAELDGQVYKTGKLRLENGDKLVLFTPGIVEASSDQGDVFGKDWFEDVLRDASNFSILQMKSSVEKELTNFIGNIPQQNDITLFMIQSGKFQSPK